MPNVKSNRSTSVKRSTEKHRGFSNFFPHNFNYFINYYVCGDQFVTLEIDNAITATGTVISVVACVGSESSRPEGHTREGTKEKG